MTQRPGLRAEEKGTMRRRKNQQRWSDYPQKLGQVLQQALKQRHISLRIKDQPLWDAWGKAVGPAISRQTRVDRFDRDTLFVKVSSSVWMQQLQFMKKEILGRLNETLGQETVKNLFFSIGDTAAGQPKKTEAFRLRPDEYPLQEADERLIERCTASVTDKELHEILKRAMTKHLIRRKMEDSRKSP